MNNRHPQTRAASSSRSDARAAAGGALGAPGPSRWQRTTSISDDAYTGTALLMIIRISTPE